MNRIKKLFFLSSILFSVILIKCDYNSDFDNDIKPDCGSIICTMELRSITVVIRHKTDSTLYHLSDYKVNRVSDNLDITPTHDNLSGYSGYYTVANDAKTDMFKFVNVEVEFTGIVNNLVVLQKRLIVSADCCHIFLVSGETKFYI